VNRQLFEQVRDKYKTLSSGGHPGRIVHAVCEAVGLTDGSGRRLRDRRTQDFRLAEKPKYSATDFNPARLAEAIIGPDWKHALGFDSDAETVAIPKLLRVQEEAASAVGPSMWANVAAWTASVGGLMQAAFLEGYEQAPYDVWDLFPTRQAIFWQGGERMISMIGAADPAPEVGPGEEHPDMPISALWVEPGPMKKYGGKIVLAKETGAIDISGGGILAASKTGGDSLKYRQNELALDIITGQTANFKLGFLADSAATGYATYGATIGASGAIPNDLTNPLTDVGGLQRSNEAVAQLLHPVTGNPINVDMRLALFPTSMADYADAINQASGLQPMTQTTVNQAQAAPGTFPNMLLTTANPWKGLVQARASRWLEFRHRASATQTNPNRSAGLGLTGANVYRWYRMDPARFAARRVGWEPMTLDLNPGDYQMAVQGLMGGQVFSVAVQYQVLNPYAAQRNKVS
jgi:hypothetical protein